jgi:GAF domain-containing protein
MGAENGTRSVPIRMPRSGSARYGFAARAMEHGHDVIVLDTHLDERFEDMKFVVAEARIRFCAGAPVQDARGEIIGGMCIVSPQPRDEFSDADKKKLKA